MNENIAQSIREGDYPSYIKERFPEVADYEELVFTNQDFHDVDWRKFPSSMNSFINCNLDGLILSPGQPIKIESCSAINIDIRGITAIIHAAGSDFSGLQYDKNTVLANSKDPSDIPSSFCKCKFDFDTMEYFQNQGVIFKD